MKKIYLLLMFIALAGMGFGQTTIWSEDFESDGDGGTRYQSSNTFNDGVNDHFARTNGSDISGTYNTPNNSNFWAGEDLDDNGGDGNPDKTITFNSVSISGYSSLSFSGLFASGNSGSGWDSSDELYLEYSLDGGAYTKFMQFAAPSSGSNVGLNYDADLDGTGEGAAITTTFTEYSKSLGVTGSTIQFRIYAKANSASEEFGFDYFKLQGTAPSSNDTDTEVYDSGSQPAATTISSLEDTDAEAVSVFKLDIEDAGTADGLVTHVTKIRVKPHTTNTADWTDNIQGVKLNDGSPVTIGSPTITDTYIDIPIVSGNLDISNGGSKTVTMSVYLNTSNITDGGILSFMVDADNHGFTADASGSDFISPFTLGDFNSNDFTITVVATKFTYNQQPTNVGLNTVMSPNVLVAFTDINGNTDKDEDGTGSTVTLTTTSTFAGDATTAVDASSGVATFSNLKFSALGTGKTITAADTDGGEISSLESETFDVTNDPQTGDVVINEIMYNSPGDDEEWIELYNTTANSILLDASWVLSNTSASWSYTFDGSKSIASGGYLTIEVGSSGSFPFTPDIVRSSSANQLVNSTSTLTLKYNVSTIDAVTYDDGSPWPTNPDGTGPSLELIQQDLDNSSASNWQASAPNGGTPGTINSSLYGTWNGSTSSTWSNNANWSTQSPYQYSDITIPSGTLNSPTVDGTTISPSTCNNLTVESGASLTIPVDKALTVNGTLTNNAGVSGLVIESGATGNGSLIFPAGTNPLATVQRYVTSHNNIDADGWHEFCSPVSMTVAGSDWQPGTATPNLDDLYMWGESTNTWLNYKQSEFSNLVQGTGYLCAFETAATKDFTGTLTSSDFTYSNMSYTAAEGEGWNLVGNPFSSAIEYNNGGWTFTNVGTVCSVWDESAANYINPAIGDPIPATNAFFVQVSSATNTLTIPASARTHNATNNYKNSTTVENTLGIKVTSDVNEFNNQIKVAFKTDANEGWDIKYDAHKLWGMETAPQLWTISNNEYFSVNTLPFSNETKDVPLYFSSGVETANFTLTFSDVNSFYQNSNIVLEDKLTGESINLDEQQFYNFIGNKSDATDRFVLHFYGVNYISQLDESSDNIDIYSSFGDIIVKSKNGNRLNGHVEVYNLMGQKFYSENLNSSILSRISMKLNSGIYVVKVRLEDGNIYSQKIIL